MGQGKSWEKSHKKGFFQYENQKKESDNFTKISI